MIWSLSEFEIIEPLRLNSLFDSKRIKNFFYAKVCAHHEPIRNKNCEVLFYSDFQLIYRNMDPSDSNLWIISRFPLHKFTSTARDLYLSTLDPILIPHVHGVLTNSVKCTGLTCIAIGDVVCQYGYANSLHAKR